MQWFNCFSYSLNNSNYDREINNLIEFARKSKEEVKLFIVTFEENKVINIDNYLINVISLKIFLLMEWVNII